MNDNIMIVDSQYIPTYKAYDKTINFYFKFTEKNMIIHKTLHKKSFYGFFQLLSSKLHIKKKNR